MFPPLVSVLHGSSRSGAYIKIGCQIAHKKRYISALCVTFHDKWCPDAATHHKCWAFNQNFRVGTGYFFVI